MRTIYPTSDPVNTGAPTDPEFVAKVEATKIKLRFDERFADIVIARLLMTCAIDREDKAHLSDLLVSFIRHNIDPVIARILGHEDDLAGHDFNRTRQKGAQVMPDDNWSMLVRDLIKRHLAETGDARSKAWVTSKVVGIREMMAYKVDVFMQKGG